MAIYPVAGAFLLVWLFVTLRNADNGVPMVVAVLPFGMFAAISLGGLSLILANFVAMLTIGVLLLRWFSMRQLYPTLYIPTAGLFLIFFALYSLFSAFILVRIFQGQFLVFPMNVTYKSTQISIFFPSTMVPLWPTKSNISQSFYILLSSMFFLAAVLVFRSRGLRFAETGLIWAASINILLGVLDFLQLDALLSVVRTADYSLANEHTMAGFARVIGGYAEASAFGAASAGFAAYFLMSFVIGYRVRDGALALGNLAFAGLAFSSTAFLAICAALLLIVLHARVFLHRHLSKNAAHGLVIAFAGLVGVGCLLVMFTPVLEFMSDLTDRLLFSKRDSLSGMERSAWAQAGMETFYRTYGLGAGAGSLRANGLMPVLLGSVGLPGTLAFVIFLYYAVGKPIHFADWETHRVFYASRVCALTLLASMLVSATVPDPTLFLMLVTALAVVSRETALKRVVTHAPRLRSQLAVDAS